MRYCKLLLMGGIVLALSSPVWALTWLNLPPADGLTTGFRLDILDWSMAKTYLQPTPSAPVEGVGAVNALPTLGATPGAKVIARPQVGLGGIGGALLGQTEDGWGIIYVLSINADPGFGTFWSAAADPSRELVGLYYGAVDTMVVVDTDGTQRVSAAGLFVDFYDQPIGTFGVGLGSAGRTAFDKYTGVGYDAAGNAIVGSTRVMRLESTDDKAWADQTLASDIDGDLDPDGDFAASFVPQPLPVGSGTGKSDMFMDLVGGDWLNGLISIEVVPNYFPLVDPRFGSSLHADLHAGQDFDPASLGPSDWTITSDDPSRGGLRVVPEPVTMAGMLLGIGCLGRYLRKRR